MNFNFAMQSTGAYKAASRLAIATPPPAYVLSRGIGWQVSWFHAFVVVAKYKGGKWSLQNYEYEESNSGFELLIIAIGRE